MALCGSSLALTKPRAYSERGTAREREAPMRHSIAEWLLWPRCCPITDTAAPPRTGPPAGSTRLMMGAG